MKGISDVIAVLLMLIITIALAGLAYAYITGVFTSRTAVVLSVDAAGSQCTSNKFNIMVRNDGTAKSGSVTVTITNSSGNSQTCTTIDSIAAGEETNSTCSRTLTGAGYYSVRVTTTGASASGTIYCAS